MFARGGRGGAHEDGVDDGNTGNVDERVGLLFVMSKTKELWLLSLSLMLLALLLLLLLLKIVLVLVLVLALVLRLNIIASNLGELLSD